MQNGFRMNTNSGTGRLLKSSGTRLARVVIATAGADGNTLTLYDGTNNEGTVIGVYDTTNLRPIEIGVTTDNGLFAVLNTGTAADLLIVLS
jgi:hypothetical protein